MNSKSLFGEHFKYVLTLTALALMAYTLPSVKDTIASGYASQAYATAAVIQVL